MEEELLNIAEHNIDRTLSGRELERANAIRRFHSHTDDSISPSDRARNSTGRVSAFRPYQKAVIGPYDRPSVPEHRNRTTNGFSIDELLGNREAIDNAIPTLEDLVTARPATPDPRYRKLVHDKWVPSNWNNRATTKYIARDFNWAKSGIENNRGFHRSQQYPSQALFSEYWTQDVNSILQRRAKVVIHGKKHQIDHSELLYKNRDHLIAYFHGDTRSTDNLLNWWGKL